MSKNAISNKKDHVLELEENLWEAWSIFGRGPGCFLYDTNDLLWFETPIPIIPYNGVLKFRLQANVDQEIDSIINHFTQKKVQFMWIIHPSSRPADLKDRLKHRGLMDVEPIIGMTRNLEDLPNIPPLPDNIEIRKISDERDVSAFHQFARWRWHVPKEYKDQYAAVVEEFGFGQSGSKTHIWQAWRDEQPVSKVVMYLGARSAGIYAVATKPEARRLGLARTLTLTALHEAHSLGYELAVLHSSPMAESLYRSLGFDTIAEFRLFGSEEVHI
jgi:ribosomal protein S18 acetylase RimI-like enzyme